MKKTLKREVAVLLLLFWGSASISIFWVMDAARIETVTSPYMAMTYAVLGYAAAAFGMHSIATQFGQK